MDPLTHGALGATAAIAGTGNRNPRLAAGVGWLAGMFPDIDIVIRSANDPLVGLIYHRHFTHSLLFVPVAAAVAAAPFLLLPKFREQRTFIFVAALLGAVTHAPLDAATTYGTLIWWPFSERRVSWDLIGIVDPVFTLALLAGIAVAVATRARAVAARVALAFCIVYIDFGGIQQARAEAALARLAEARGHTPERLRAMPQLGALHTWRGVYETEGRIHAEMLRVPYFGGPIRVREGSSVPVATLETVDATLADDPNARRGFRVIHWFAEGWVGIPPGSTRFVGDMRYTMDVERMLPMWGLTLDPAAPSGVRWGMKPEATAARRDSLRELWKAGPDMVPLEEVLRVASAQR